MGIKIFNKISANSENIILFLLACVITIPLWLLYYNNFSLYFYHDDWVLIAQVINFEGDFLQCFTQPTVNEIYRPVLLSIFYIGNYNFGLDPSFFANIIKYNVFLIGIILYFLGTELKSALTGFFSMIFFYIFSLFRFEILWIQYGVTQTLLYVFFLSSLYFLIKFVKTDTKTHRGHKIIFGTFSFILGIGSFLTYELSLLLPMIVLFYIIIIARTKINLFYAGFFLFTGIFFILILPEYLLFHDISHYGHSQALSWREIFDLEIFIERVGKNFPFYFNNYWNLFLPVGILVLIIIGVLFYSKNNSRESTVLFLWMISNFSVLILIRSIDYRYFFGPSIPFCLIISLAAGNSLNYAKILAIWQWNKIKHREVKIKKNFKKKEYINLSMGIVFTSLLIFAVVNTNNNKIIYNETVDDRNNELIQLENNVRFIVSFIQDLPNHSKVCFQPQKLTGIRNFGVFHYILVSINRKDLRIVSVEYNESLIIRKGYYAICINDSKSLPCFKDATLLSTNNYVFIFLI